VSDQQLDFLIEIASASIPCGCDCLNELLITNLVLHNLETSDCESTPISEMQSYDEKIKYAIMPKDPGDFTTTSWGRLYLQLLKKCEIVKRSTIGDTSIYRPVKVKAHCAHDCGGCH
jgi:hypothetical protein